MRASLFTIDQRLRTVYAIILENVGFRKQSYVRRTEAKVSAPCVDAVNIFSDNKSLIIEGFNNKCFYFGIECVVFC